MSYVTPRNYYPTRLDDLRLIVIHTMEAPESEGRARQVAQWFAGPSAPEASAHACIDNREVVLCLPPSATAWAAPGANSDGYQIEHAGYAGQNASDWADAYSTAMLALSAAHARQIAQQAGIPLRHLTDAQLDAGESGFVGHDQVSRVYRRSDHTDPGSSFPWARYMALVGGSNPDAAVVGLAVDGYLGALTITRLQQVLGTSADGFISGQWPANAEYLPALVAVEYSDGGSQAVAALQARLGVDADGYLGPDTVKAWQTKLGVPVGGYLGITTGAAIQRALNGGRIY